MVRLSVFGSSVLLLALIAGRPAAAGPVTFTGNVAHDFPVSNTDVTVIPGLTDPMNIGQPSWMTSSGFDSGWAIKDIRTNYDDKTDTLYVGVNTFTNSHGQTTVFGDAYGSGTEADPALEKKAGGFNPTKFGGDKSFTIAFAPSVPNSNPPAHGQGVFVVGIPANKADQGGPGLDGFNAATFKNTGLGLEYSYGKTLTQNLGTVAFEPSLQHPGLEFTIPNFSKIPGLKTGNGVWFSAYAGSAQDGGVGEFSQPWYLLPPHFPQVITPEPATVLTWTLVAGAAAWRIRRRRSSQR